MSGERRRFWVAALCVAACGNKDQPRSAPRAEGSAAALVREAFEPVVLRPVRVTASSSQPPSAGYTYETDNLLDGNLATSWQPAKTDHGPHWITLELADELTVTDVGIANGFQTRDRFGDEFLLNRRIARARLRFDDASELAIHFDRNDRAYVHTAVPDKTTRSITVLVDETYPGSKWNDLAVSEIEVRGLPARPAAPAAPAAVAATAESWWTPPRSRRQDVEALAYGFAGLDEHDLGRVFTSDFQPVENAPSMFEVKPFRRVARGQMEHVVVKLRDRSQLDAGFNYLFLKAGVTHSTSHDYQVARAMQIKEVVRLDDTARMRQPPAEATFYLAEVHLGASFDLLVQGDHAAMGAKLELALTGTGDLSSLRESSSYHLKAFGLGLRDVTGDAIFSMSADQIAQRYRIGDPVPVQLVFRVIPGRRFQPEELPVPHAVIDQPMFNLPEGAFQAWQIRPGRYHLVATSAPNGMALAWLAGDVRCDQQIQSTAEYRSLEMTCDVASNAELQVSNPTSFGLGPSEAMSVYLGQLP